MRESSSPSPHNSLSHQLLSACVTEGASDLHISTGEPPHFRIVGELVRFGDVALSAAQVDQLLQTWMTEVQWAQLLSERSVDLACTQPAGRFRINAFHHQRGRAAALRRIPPVVPRLEELDLPPIFDGLKSAHHGLVLITGATGSGKSTTLAALVDAINRERAAHIVTLEDPIEFMHASQTGLVHQRQVGRDSRSFQEGLRAALRQDPDVIMIGELRDAETIRLALTAAETGHLVLASLHTVSAPKAIDRIIDVFDGGEKALVRAMLAQSLRAVIAQQLLPAAAGGRVAVCEVMTATPAIRNLIREGQVAQMLSAMQTGQVHGMMTMDQALRQRQQAGHLRSAVVAQALTDV